MSFEQNQLEDDGTPSLAEPEARTEAVAALDAFARTVTYAVSRYRTLNLYLSAHLTDNESAPIVVVQRESRHTPDAPLRHELHFASVPDAQAWLARKLVYAEALTQANQKEVVLKQALLMAEAPHPKLNPHLVREAMRALSANTSRVGAQMAELGMVTPRFVVRIDIGPEGEREVRHELEPAGLSAFAA